MNPADDIPVWIGLCVNLRAEDLEAYDDTERDIKYATFARLLGPVGLQEIAESYPGVPHISKDWHVEFGRGRWKGKPAVCMHHSQIHHLWLIAPNRLKRSKPSQAGRRSADVCRVA